MSDNKDLIEHLIDDKYEEYIKKISQESSAIKQKFVRGGSISTRCPACIVALYDEKMQCLIDDIINTINNSNIIPDFEHLEKKINIITEKLYNKAKSNASAFLVNHGFAGFISQFDNTIDEKCKDTIRKNQTKVSLFRAKIEKQIESEAPAKIKDFLWLIKNRKYWWVWLILIFFGYLTIDKVIIVIKWLINTINRGHPNP